MNLLIIASFLLLSVVIAITLRSNKKKEERIKNDFWEMERMANNTRRKSLDHLNYITIPLDELPMDLLSEDVRIADYTRLIRELSELPIVNFTGLSNTELKLRYGAPNLDLLMSYDQNYTLLACTLQKWAKEIYDRGYKEEAKDILEFAISTGTDVSGTFRLLCQIYSELDMPQKIGSLYPIAETLNSAMQNSIFRILAEYDQSVG